MNPSTALTGAAIGLWLLAFICGLTMGRGIGFRQGYEAAMDEVVRRNHKFPLFWSDTKHRTCKGETRF